MTSKKQPSGRSINLVKRGKCWWPADQHAEEFTDAQADGKEDTFERFNVKSPKEVRWFFAMLREVMKHIPDDQFRNTEELRHALLIEAGLYRWRRRRLFGTEYRYEEPFSFTEMDDDQFRAFKEKALDLIQQHYDIDPRELMREVDGTQKWTGPMPWDGKEF